jgi:folate-binding protein YgfZ
MIGVATQDRFVPQAANWDLIGGLDFRKGCYTGQEIVARTQHLGRLKERLFAYASDADPPPPGTSLYSDTFGEQACGTVVNSARDAIGAAQFLAVAQIAAAQAGPLAIGAVNGPVATLVSLPYAVPAPTAPRSRVGA